jgi:arylsulfatase A-like enzyme
MLDSSPKRPNVIVFFTDQQRWDTTGVHGNPLELTPNFDRMAQRGTHVYNAITCQPVCAPARASLQTGLYATRTTVYRNGIALPGDQKTLAHYFGAAGYRTGYIGKWHLAGQGSHSPRPTGRLSVVVGRESARIHLRRLRYGDV